MRTDVKLGVVISLAIVLVAGGYYVYRDQQHEPIPITAGSDSTLHTEKSARPSRSVPQTAKSKPGASRKDRRTAKRESGSSPTTRGSTPGARKAPAGQPSQKRAAADRSKRTRPQEDRKTRSQSAQAKHRKAKTNKRTTPHNTRPAVTSPPKLADAKPAPTKQAASERVTDRTNGASRNAGRQTKRSGHLDKKAQKRSSVMPPSESPRTVEQRHAPQNRTLAAARKSQEEKPTATTRAATPRKPMPPDAAVDIHRVQPGDTFSSLASMYYGDVKYTQFLMERNAAVRDPKRLAVGTEIRIPALPITKERPAVANPVVKAASKSPIAPKGKTYTVKSGDTFYAIARDSLGDAARWRELLALNKRIVNGDPTRLQVGQVITLPD